MDTLLPVVLPYLFPFYMIVLPSLLQRTCSSWLQIPQCNFFMIPNTPIFVGKKKVKEISSFLFSNSFLYSCLWHSHHVYLRTLRHFLGVLEVMALLPLIAMPKDQYRQLALSLAKWRGVLWNITNSLKHHMPTKTLEMPLFWWATMAAIQEFFFFNGKTNTIL